MLKLDNIDIYKGEDELFIMKGDSYFFKITGVDCIVLELIIKAFIHESNKEIIYKEVRSLVTYTKYSNLINWLVKNNILIEEPPKLIKSYHKIGIWGDFPDSAQLENIIVKQLETLDNKYEL